MPALLTVASSNQSKIFNTQSLLMTGIGFVSKKINTQPLVMTGMRGVK